MMSKQEKTEKDGLDESLRRLGGILASPSLVLSYGHTTPLLERSWLRRRGLTKTEAEAFLEQLCRRSLMDEGARAVTEAVCLRRGIAPEEAVRRLLLGEDWPDEDHTDDESDAI